jgi:hypothetical protein
MVNRFTVAQADGAPADPQARYLVLRLDQPENDAERVAAQVYALCTAERDSARDVLAWLADVTANLPAGEFFTPEFVPKLGYYMRTGGDNAEFARSGT